MTISGADGRTRAKRPSAGRPRASSRRTLEDAASELFLEQGYAATTIDQIAARAGVGRNTFFNYFAAKSDLLWIDFDETLAGFDDALAAVPDDTAPVAAAESALLALAERHPRSAVPIALSQHESMATLEEFRAAGLERFVGVARRLAACIAARSGLPETELLVQSAAAALAAALASGAGAWALAGVGRAPLAGILAEALAPVRAGFEPAIAARAADPQSR